MGNVWNFRAKTWQWEVYNDLGFFVFLGGRRVVFSCRCVWGDNLDGLIKTVAGVALPLLKKTTHRRCFAGTGEIWKKALMLVSRRFVSPPQKPPCSALFWVDRNLKMEITTRVKLFLFRAASLLSSVLTSRPSSLKAQARKWEDIVWQGRGCCGRFFLLIAGEARHHRQHVREEVATCLTWM